MRSTLLGFVLIVACSTHREGPDGGAGDAAGDGSPGGAICGGLLGARCAASEYCDYPDNGCGVGDQTGTCQPRPQACPLIASRPTCACDGNIYSGECDAYEGGFDLNAHGTCPVDKGWFACGYTQCVLATQYCKREQHAGSADRYSCVQLPAGCTSQAPSCACLVNEPCGRTCSGNATVGLTLTCPG